jgi:uncharacterized protein (TIGR03437 family)
LLFLLLACTIVGQARPFVYVSNYNSRTLSEVDLATGVVTRTTNVETNPRAVAVTPDGRFIYVAHFVPSGNILVINAETFERVNTISGVGRPWDLVFSPDGQFVYVTSYLIGGTIAVVDTSTRVVVKTIPVGNLPSKIVASPDGSYLYVITAVNNVGSVKVIRVSDYAIVNTITVGKVADDMSDAVISRDGARLYVINHLDNTVSVIDTSNGVGNGVIKAINVIDSPYWVTINPSGTRTYVASRPTNRQGQVIEVDTATGATLGGPLDVGLRPNRMAISPDGTQLYLTAASPLQSSLTATNAASFSSGPMAGESIGAIFSVNLAGGVQVAATLPLPTSLGGTVIKVKDIMGVERLAPLFFVSPSQVNYQVPAGTVAGTAAITASSTHGFVSISSKQIISVAPGLFSANANGQGVAAAVVLRIKADSSQFYEPVAVFDQAQNRFIARPIDLGPTSDQVFLILYGTGFRFRSSLSAVTATIGGANSEVLFAGPAPGFVGLDQVNLRLSRSLIGRGVVNVELRVEGQSANLVEASFR